MNLSFTEINENDDEYENEYNEPTYFQNENKSVETREKENATYEIENEKRKTLTYNDILNNMNLKVNKGGKLEFLSKKPKKVSFDSSAIPTPSSHLSSIPKKLSIQEKKQKIIQFLNHQNQIKQIKSTKLFFTNPNHNHIQHKTPQPITSSTSTHIFSFSLRR
jgi:hypothetical protein